MTLGKKCSEYVDGIVAAREPFGEIQARVTELLRGGDALLDGPRVSVRSLDSGILLECDPHGFLESKRLTRPCCRRLALGGRAHGQENAAQN